MTKGWDDITARANLPAAQGGVAGFTEAKLDRVYPTMDDTEVACKFTFTLAGDLGGYTMFMVACRIAHRVACRMHTGPTHHTCCLDDAGANFPW